LIYSMLLINYEEKYLFRFCWVCGFTKNQTFQCTSSLAHHISAQPLLVFDYSHGPTPSPPNPNFKISSTSFRGSLFSMCCTLVLCYYQPNKFMVAGYSELIGPLLVGAQPLLKTRMEGSFQPDSSF